MKSFRESAELKDNSTTESPIMHNPDFAQTNIILEEDKKCMLGEQTLDNSTEASFNSGQDTKPNSHCFRMEDPCTENSTLGSFRSEHNEEVDEDRETLLCLLADLVKLAPSPERKLSPSLETSIHFLTDYLNTLQDLYQLVSLDFHPNSPRSELPGYYKELLDNAPLVYLGLVLCAAYTKYIPHPPHDKYYSIPSKTVKPAESLCACFEIVKQDFINSSTALISSKMTVTEITERLKSTLQRLSDCWISFESV
eukprot:TRINITY_DN1928_c0_g1_i1.p1 TRINITY_DN1928_c0_g1~~TRINITY_DN1928_c0_g1_i1.p1  ORF type:complete len:274 (+),score=19.08 TRINITY_DN1928_c0_g1_i1:64-822(+)